MTDEAPSAPQPPTAHGKRSGAARRKLKKERQAQFEAQFARLQLESGPSRLPPELQLKVIQAGAETTGSPYLVTDETSHRRAFLRQASLVSSLWRSEAQSLLWGTPQFRSNHAIESFLLGGEEKATGRSLTLSTSKEDDGVPSGLLSGSLVGRAIAACHDLKTLVVEDVTDVDPLVFFGQQLTREQYLSSAELADRADNCINAQSWSRLTSHPRSSIRPLYARYRRCLRSPCRRSVSTSSRARRRFTTLGGLPEEGDCAGLGRHAGCWGECEL